MGNVLSNLLKQVHPNQPFFEDNVGMLKLAQ